VSLPNLQEYNEAIQAPQICFTDPELRSASVECNRLGLPRPRSGNFATVYKLEAGAKKWAVKCFNRELRDQQERYAAINAYLRQVSFPFTVGFAFLTTGIRVRGEWYPILKMEWADGEPLNSWIQRNLQDPVALLGFLQSFRSMLATMQQASVAHGDLQHGNILVVNGAPKLVDYDGMYVPTLSGRLSNEVGQPNYQLPSRTSFDFGPYLDNFSAWVIQLSIFALTIDPKLWQTFKGGDDCLLFRKRDFEVPNQSTLLKALESERNPALLQMVALFRTILGCSPQTVPSIDGTFSVSLPVSSRSEPAGGASWIYDHLPSSPKPTSGVNARNDAARIDWVLDATSSPGPPVHFENSVEWTRSLAYLCILFCFGFAILAFLESLPALLLVLPALVGINLVILRTNYRREPALSELDSTRDKQAGLRERIRMLENRIADVEAEKQKSLRSLIDRKTSLQKEERGLQQTEYKARADADKALQNAVSGPINNKQILVAQETSELNNLQNGLGRTVATLTHSISSLAQAEANEISNTLKAKQTNFVQNKLRASWIATTQIAGIGAAYKTRLQAAGFHTAADIDYYGVQRVQGIGDVRANALKMWRQTIEMNARAQMPQSLSQQEEGAIHTKYALQKSTLQTQLDQGVRDLRNLESSIRTKFASLRAPHDSQVNVENQKHQLELDRIAGEFREKRNTLTRKLQDLEEEQVQTGSRFDSRQQEIRKEMFQLQWQMGKVEREMRRFSDVSFRAYVKHILLFR